MIFIDKTLAYFVTLLRKDFTSYCNQKLQELELSQGLLFFILYIGRHPGCSPKELTEALHMDTGHVTRSLSKLEESGFLLQKCNPIDRRSHILQLQEKGAEAFRISHELFTNWDNEIMNELSEESRAQLLTLLEKITKMEGEIYCVRDTI